MKLVSQYKFDNAHLLGFFILIFGACLRLYGIDFGFPDLLHLDEPFEINRALRLASGSFDFSRAGKGGLYYIISLEYAILFVGLYLAGITKTPSEFAYFFVGHEDIFYLFARVTSALIGVACLFLIYRIAKKIGGKTVGLIAMLLMSVSSLNVIHAHYATVDILLVFFLLLTWLYILNIAIECKKKDFYLAGFFGGLSIITKLPGIVIIIPMLLTCFLCRFLRSTSTGKLRRYFAAMIIIFVVVTFAGEPGYIKTIKNIDSRISGLYEKNAGNDDVDSELKKTRWKPSNVNLYHLYSTIIIKDIGLPFFFIFILSLFYFLYQRSFVEILILSFSVPYFIAICSTSSVLYFERYTLPLLPLIILTTSRGIGKLSEYLRNKVSLFSSWNIQILLAIVIFFLCIPNIINSVEYALKFKHENPRIQAKKWIQTNIKSGGKILMQGFPEHRSQLIVPLVNSKKNIDEMINLLKSRDSGKSFYWQLRGKYLDSLDVPRYDLVLIQNIEPWMEYETFKRSDIEYVVFDVGRLQRDYKGRTDPVSSTRTIFYQNIVQDPKVNSIANFEGEIVIFRKLNGSR